VSPLTITCETEAQTQLLGQDIAAALKSGDLVTLEGDLGAGKTFLVRAIIRAAAGDEFLEVPSPTFTLLQSYKDLPFGQLAHLDLYRLTTPSELDELGLDEALEDGVALVEWPQNGVVEGADISVQIEIGAGDKRTFSFDGNEAALARLQRSFSIRKYLNAQGFVDARRNHLTGDASTRAYEFIYPADGSAALILMNAPATPDGPPIKNGKPYSQIAHLAEDMSAFVGAAKLLRDAKFRVPEILHADLDSGLLLIENLGSGAIVTADRKPISERYLVATEILAKMHQTQWSRDTKLANGQSHHVPEFDHGAISIELDLLPSWYADHVLGRQLTDQENADYVTIWDRLIDQLQVVEKSLALRDFHSPNLIWIDKANGIARVGLIDFQDALWAPSAYDVASLVHDARIDISPNLEAQLVNHYCALRNAQSGFDEAQFHKSLAIMQAQRACKLHGIFVRLSKRDGKDAYLAHLPRIESYLTRACKHPALAELQQWVNTVLRV